MKRAMISAALILLYVLAYAEVNDDIKIPQTGFRIKDAKYIIISRPGENYFIFNKQTGKKVYSGSLGAVIKDYDSGDDVYICGFSDVKEPGEYYAKLDNKGESYTFSISDNVYREPFKKVMRGFYLQRCGTSVSDPGGWAHGPCHLEKALYHPDAGAEGYRDISGGWHDAGDYGRYIVNSGLSTGTLLLMFERYANKLEDFSMGIPKKERGLPDVLEEIKYNLDWMLKMQREDGGVYHKATKMQFAKMQMKPEDDTASVYIYEVTTTATGDFSAVMAIASRVFGRYDSAYSAKCLKAAVMAWRYLVNNKNIVPSGGYKNPSGTNTGEYGDSEDKDERFWAAVELFNTTGSKEYNDYVLENAGNWSPKIDAPAWWQDVHAAAMLSYAFSLQPKNDRELVENIKEDLRTHADACMQRIEQENGYRYVLKEENYIWGSNSVALNYAINLIAADELLLSNKYSKGAVEVLHYIFGRNPFNMSYVTGIGENAVMFIHHRPSVASGLEEPYPGLLAGGPNRRKQDNVLRALEFGTPSARCYKDDTGSYSGNEIAINWNAPLAYVLAAMLPDRIEAPE